MTNINYMITLFYLIFLESKASGSQTAPVRSKVSSKL